MSDSIIFIIIVVVCMSIFLYLTYKPSIEIIKREDKIVILLWYNEFTDYSIERNYKKLISFKL